MGGDKALLEIDGVAMAERVARAVAAAGCAPVAFVGGDRDRLAALGRPVHADQWPGQGPLGGVITALAAAGGDDVVVAACDLPFLDQRTVEALLAAARGREDGIDVVVARTDRLEPGLAWWNAAASSVIEGHWQRGVRALHEVIAELQAVEVAIDPAALRNVNTPADLR